MSETSSGRDQNALARRLKVDDIRRAIEEAERWAGPCPPTKLSPALKTNSGELRIEVIGRRCEFSELAETDLTEIALYIATDSPQLSR